MNNVQIASLGSGGSGDLNSLSITNLAAKNRGVVNFLWICGISSMPTFKRAKEGEYCIAKPVTWWWIVNILDQNLASFPQVHKI